MAPRKACTAAQMAPGVAKMRGDRKGQSMKDRIQVSKLLAGALLGGLCLLAFLGTAKVHDLPSTWVIDNPTVTIAGATATTTATPSTAAHEAHIQWTFGTVAGSYTTCTVQAKTTFDGSTWLTVGSAE